MLMRHGQIDPAIDHTARQEVLTELGEWMALGFYEALAEPWPRAYGRAFRRLYENMDIVIPADRLLLPCEPLPHAMNQENAGVWTATALICDFDHNRGLRVNRGIAKFKAEQFPHHADFIADLCTDLEARLPHFGGYTHSNPDIRRIIDHGVLAMASELDAELQAVRRELAAGSTAELDEQLHLLEALTDYVAGVTAFHARTLAAARATLAKLDDPEQWRRRQLIADEFAQTFLHPARTFVQGLLSAHCGWLLDGHDSIGRLDQALGELFARDLAAGTLDLELARDLLDEVWQNFERFNGWNLQLGGYTAAGDDGCNQLTRECLEACRRNHFRRPNVALRITRKTPDDVVEQAVAILADGSGRPALYNDDLYLATLLGLDLGLTREDVCELGFGGCTETMIGGLSNVGSLDGEINLAKALELALYDGWDPVAREQAGPHTGAFQEFQDFDAFVDAVKRQIQWLTDQRTAWLKSELKRRFHTGDPKLYRTFFTRDCVRRRQSFEAGGARYNWSVISYQGIANLIDSLAAVRDCVFARGEVGKDELLEALRADFQGCDRVRQKLQAAPKFGNDLAAADDLGADLIGYAWQELLSHETPRGGRFLPSCILFVTYYGAGLRVGATPDGRRAGEVLTDSVGAAQGRDVHGPTALLKSVTRLPLSLAVGTPVLNLRFPKDLLRARDGQRGAAALIRTYFAAGGLQLQLSALDAEELLAAQREPEKHGDLIVRVGGYSEYFTRLNRELQDSVIARTGHHL